MSEEKRLTFAGYGYVVFVRIDRPKRRFSVIDDVILLHSACPVRDTLVFPSFGRFGRKRFEYASSGRVFLENGEFKDIQICETSYPGLFPQKRKSPGDEV